MDSIWSKLSDEEKRICLEKLNDKTILSTYKKPLEHKDKDKKTDTDQTKEMGDEVSDDEDDNNNVYRDEYDITQFDEEQDEIDYYKMIDLKEKHRNDWICDPEGNLEDFNEDAYRSLIFRFEMRQQLRKKEEKSI